MKKSFILIVFALFILLSCSSLNNIHDPTHYDNEQYNDEEFKGYVISDKENIIQYDGPEDTKIFIKEADDIGQPYDFYLTESQLKKLKDGYSEDAFNLINVSKKEFSDQMKLRNLNYSLMEYQPNNYSNYDPNLFKDAKKYKSKIIEVGDYAYCYNVIDLDYYGPVVLYTVYKKEGGEWQYYTYWAYTHRKKNISKEDFLKKELIYNDADDDMTYFSIINVLSSDGYERAALFLSNGQTGYAKYGIIYGENASICYHICKEITLLKFHLFDILKAGDEPEEVLKNFEG